MFRCAKNLPRHLWWHPPPNSFENMPPLAGQLAGHLFVSWHTFRIILHRPYVGKEGRPGQTSHQEPDHLGICTQSAVALAQGLKQMWQQMGPLVFHQCVRGVNNYIFDLSVSRE